VEYDVQMELSISVTSMITEGLKLLLQHFDELKINRQKLSDTIFSQMVLVKATVTSIVNLNHQHYLFITSSH
jgi:hypothetical protein